MDHDGDGTLDLISGCYDPGDIFVARGLGEGAYGKFEALVDEAGTPLVHHPVKYRRYEKISADPDADKNEVTYSRVASFGSWPAAVDWDADGDLDMLIGSFAGKLYLRMNKGTRTKPVYSADVLTVDADGEPLDVGGHCNPVVADWNDDGLWDLVIGAHDGSVSWYRNIGSAGKPAFAARRTLVEAKAKMKFMTQYVQPGELPGPGVRAQICVTDMNGDGRLDLLLGDCSRIVPLRGLDEKEGAEFAALCADELSLSDRMYEAQAEGGDTEELQKAYEAIAERKKGFHAEGTSARTSSYVWLYQRKASVEF